MRTFVYLMVVSILISFSPAYAKENPTLTPELQEYIDKWTKRNKLNQYGDPKGTMYAGGNPLFDMKTGIMKDRYDYILERNPKLKKIIDGQNRHEAHKQLSSKQIKP